MKYLLLVAVWMTGNSMHAQNSIVVQYKHKTDWIASFMTDGANDASFRHFILMPNGRLGFFAPGAKPEIFTGIEQVQSISAGSQHILALKHDGTVWAWGDNEDNQLGLAEDGSEIKHSDKPIRVKNISNVIAISTSNNASFVLLKDSTIWAWGSGCGLSSDKKNAFASARRVNGIHNAVAIAGCSALLADGTVVTWGAAAYGALGNGTMVTTTKPVKVKGLNNVVEISARENGGMALCANGTIWAWGQNYKGQLGDGTSGNYSNVPVKTKNVSNVASIDAEAVCMALDNNGSLKAWGWGDLGGMGSKTADVVPLPIKVPLEKILAIKAGKGYAFAVLENGTVMGWGCNMMSAGYHKATSTPVKITDLW